MTTTADWLEILGIAVAAVALGSWIVVAKLGIDDELTRRHQGLNGILKIQSYTNLVMYASMCAIALMDLTPFIFLAQLPQTNPEGDVLRQYAILSTRWGLIGIGAALFVLALVIVQCRRDLDRYQSEHGPYTRRHDDPPAPEPEVISNIRGPI